MGSRRTAIVVAVVVGALGAAGTWAYLAGAERRAYGDAQLVRVLVVEKAIPRGFPGERAVDEGMIRADEIPREFRPATSVTRVDAFRGKVAASPLAAGQILVEGSFADPAAEGSFASRIPDGQVAITVKADEVRGVAHLIAPGDRVNILLATAEGVRPLYQNVNVIAVGRTGVHRPGDAAAADADPDADESSDVGLVTLAVPLVAAERIALAVATAGDDGLFLTLSPPNAQPVPVPTVTAGTLFQGPLSPYA